MPKKNTSFRVAVLSILSIALVSAMFFSATITVKPKEAAAICCSDCCFCVISTFLADTSGWVQNWLEINFYTFVQLRIHQYLYFDMEMWETQLLPLFIKMGVQLSSVGMQQVSAIGMFMDAKEQLETQRLLQELHARAHKDYHTEDGICEFGTRIASLAASERRGEINSLILSERSTDRYLGNKSTGSSRGTQADIKIRLDKYADTFCSANDNQAGLTPLCPDLVDSATITKEQRDRFNADIDYENTLLNPWTIDIDFTLDAENGGSAPPQASDAEEEILALANNLYGYDGFNRASYSSLERVSEGTITEIQSAYLNMRAVVAKTKVAENSFNALVALKSRGSDNANAANSKEFLEAYLIELGMDTGEIDEYLGDNPSYYAQMEILTKKAYQSQQFYTNLYDKPANVERKGVAIQAIGLIQKFDLLKSYLRTEASLSILLELSVQKLQREVEDNIQSLKNNSK